MGMRARAAQNGKLARTEGELQGVGGHNSKNTSEGEANDDVASCKRAKKRSRKSTSDPVPNIEDSPARESEVHNSVNAVEIREGDGIGEDVVTAKVRRKREKLKTKKAKRAAKASSEPMCDDEGKDITVPDVSGKCRVKKKQEKRIVKE